MNRNVGSTTSLTMVASPRYYVAAATDEIGLIPGG